MANFIADTVLKSIEQVDTLYHRLILIVAPSGTGKTAALQTVHSRTGARLVNVNLELSRQLLDLSERQRALQLPRQLSNIVNAVPADVVLLDNIELLFDPLLKQDPLRLLQGISRNKTLIVAWNGSIIDEHIVYATPDHAEYRRYQTNNIIVINAMNLS
jgi:predicted ATP-binding protein involved in virulence